jgi:hypothetical protein
MRASKKARWATRKEHTQGRQNHVGKPIVQSIFGVQAHRHQINSHNCATRTSLGVGHALYTDVELAPTGVLPLRTQGYGDTTHSSQSCTWSTHTTQTYTHSSGTCRLGAAKKQQHFRDRGRKHCDGHKGHLGYQHVCKTCTTRSTCMHIMSPGVGTHTYKNKNREVRPWSDQRGWK